MATTCTLSTMLAYISNPLFTLYALLWISGVVNSSENNFYANNCTSLDSFIDCSNLKLTKVVSDVPSWTRTLKLNKNELTDMPLFTQASDVSQLALGHNHIVSISRASLENMPNIEILELNNNNISKINANDFPSLPKLQNLNLNHNVITKIENGSFVGLKNLTDLKLNRNKLSELTDGMFKDLTSLKTLELNKNQFSKVSWLSFQGLELLLILKLRQNAIDDLADGAFYRFFNLRELHLDYNKLTRVDKGWLYGMSSLSHLNVSNNNIQSLSSGWESCPHLKELDLSNNQIQLITRLTFEHLTSLELLKLDNNRISFIESGAFEPLTSLRVLDLSYNHMSWIVENSSGAFAPLHKLTNLFLMGNYIFHISKGAFTGLANVTRIDLSNNTIASIEDNPFKNFKKLRELLINTSSLICDCSLKWLNSWLTDGATDIIVGNLSCLHPTNLRKKSVSSIPSKDFVCLPSDNPLPKITIQPEDATAFVNKNMTLRCGANSSLDSDMKFIWKFNEHQLDVATKRYESAQDQGVTQFSDLLLNSITRSQTGLYQCVVSNSYGVAYSRQAHLSVYEYPVFTKVPTNVVATVGGHAKFECAASGYPTPNVRWKKEGKEGFPALAERRITIMNPVIEEPFFLTKLKLVDAGVYTCFAENGYGVITANVTLTVQEVPQFFKPMKNKEILVGETILQDCMASGSPKPKVVWTKDGESLNLTKRHFLAANDQLLIIVDAIFNDTGTYECELSNVLGSIKASSKLIVVHESRNVEIGAKTMNGVSDELVFWIVLAASVVCIVLTSACWVFAIYRSRRNHRTFQTPLSPIDIKSENSSHSSKDSGTGDSTKRSYQDLLLATGNTNHSSIMHGSHSESPSPVPESTLPLLTTFHPISIDSSPYVKDGTCTKTKHNHSSSLTPVHYPNKPADHSQGIFCASPASSNGVQCACLTATFKKKAEMCDCFSNNSPVKHNCVVSHYNNVTTEHDTISCYGDVGKRPCSIPVPFHTAHSVSTNCCRHHPNSYLCLYMPPGQHSIPQ